MTIAGMRDQPAACSRRLASRSVDPLEARSFLGARLMELHASGPKHHSGVAADRVGDLGIDRVEWKPFAYGMAAQVCRNPGPVQVRHGKLLDERLTYFNRWDKPYNQ